MTDSGWKNKPGRESGDYKKSPTPLQQFHRLEDILDYNEILNYAGVGICLLDRTGRVIKANWTMSSQLFYSAEELKNKHAVDLLNQDDAEMIKRLRKETLEGKRTRYRREIRYYRKDGSIFWGDLSMTAILDGSGNVEAFAGVIFDINKQKRAEAELQKSKEYYRQVFEKFGAPAAIIEPDMTISMANEEFVKLSGTPEEELKKGMKWSRFISPEDWERVRNYHYLRRKPGSTAPEEYECCTVKDGRRSRHLFLKVGMLPDGKRSIVSFIDITSLKQTEEALRESEAKLKSIIKQAEGFIFTVNRDMKLEFINKSFIDKFGRDITGESCYKALNDLDTPCPWCNEQTVFNGEIKRLEYRNPKDGRWYYVIISPIFDAGGAVSGIEAQGIDITERKRKEVALAERAAYLDKENIRLKSSMKERFRFCDIIGKSPAMQAVYDMILKAAATDANILIHGESGTGKELVANAIHENSDRRRGPFLVVNCGAIPGALIESEFFGYKKGAFTGADHDKQGYLAASDGGTLFLDEVGEIEPGMQVKLLRVIEGYGYTPVGGNKPLYPDIRFIAATHRNLREQVKAGAMREDFFYRINVIPVAIPPLRERKEDLPLLIEYFRQTYSDKDELPPVTGEILDAIYSYNWPGNVRELQNVLYRYFALHEFYIPKSPAEDQSQGTLKPHIKLKPALARYEKDLIFSALERSKWHRGRAAGLLGISRRTLFKKMKMYGID